MKNQFTEISSAKKTGWGILEGCRILAFEISLLHVQLMRVITGSAKGYGLKAPKHMGLRPTPSRVKEAIFSSLASRIPGARILELFAGTGAFSIEALSQGAESATLVENDRRASALIEENLRKTHLDSKARLIRVDARQGLEWLQKEGEVFDLIFADPPYQKKSQEKKSFSWLMALLESAILPELLAQDGVLLVEWFKKEACPKVPYWSLGREFKFGDTLVGVFRKTAATSASP